MEYTIVATTYNDEKEISGYLHNILEFQVKPKEIIIVDGGSTDQTVTLLEIFRNKTEIPVNIISGERLNIAEGYNRAISMCRTEYIGITGIGNVYEKDFFQKLLSVATTRGADIVYSKIYGYEQNFFSKIYNKVFLYGDKGRLYKIPSNHGTVIRKDVFDRIGYFYEGFIYAGEDQEFYLRAKSSGCKIFSCTTAKVFWKTPCTFGEYRKQVKNYTIAYLQIDSLIELFKKVIFPLSLLLIIGGIIILKWAGLLFIYMIAICLWGIYRYKSLLILFGRFIHQVITLLYMIKNLKYVRNRNR